MSEFRKFFVFFRNYHGLPFPVLYHLRGTNFGGKEVPLEKKVFEKPCRTCIF